MNPETKNQLLQPIFTFIKRVGRLSQPEDKVAIKRSALSYITSSMAMNLGGPKIPTACPRCGKLQESVRAAKYHDCPRLRRGPKPKEGKTC